MSANKPDYNFKVDRVASSLRHSVTESIRMAIALRHFEPGQRLIERELCDLTGVSRTLVREALRQLETEGLITILPHRGPVVRTLTQGQAQMIYEVRRELEGLAASLFATRAGPAEREALTAAFEDLKRALTSGDQAERLHAKNRFYQQLLSGTGNDALGDTFTMLNARVTFLRATSLKASGRAKHSIEELGRLMLCIEARDAEAARKAAIQHVDAAAKEALRQLSA